MSLPALQARIISAPRRSVKTAPSAYPRGWVVVLLIADLTMFVLSNYLAVIFGLRHWNFKPFFLDRLFIAVGVSIVLWLLIFWQLGLYKRTFALSTRDELYYTVAALSLGVAPQLLLFTILPRISTSRIVMLLALAISIVTVGATRALLHGIRTRTMRRRRRVVVVGNPDRCAQTLEALDLSEGASTLIIPVSESELTGDETPAKTGLGRMEWLQQASDWGCDTLLLTEMLPPRLMPQLLDTTARNQIQFAFAPPRFRYHAYGLSLQKDGEQALIVPSQLRACTPRARLAKRLFDLIFASIALVIFSPIMLAAAITVYLESGHPVLYRQRRVGRDGNEFDMLKFRSMRKDAEVATGPVWAIPGDMRKTRVGSVLRRLSFDELPQLFNVLRGDMSLVGPRPERRLFVENFRETFPRYDERHLVRPGITGWSQIHMKRVLQPTDAGEKLAYDLYYVEQWSLFLDVSVLIQTVAEFLFHRAG